MEGFKSYEAGDPTQVTFTVLGRACFLSYVAAYIVASPIPYVKDY